MAVPGIWGLETDILVDADICRRVMLEPTETKQDMATRYLTPIFKPIFMGENSMVDLLKDPKA
jgi:hypothetical protein